MRIFVAFDKFKDALSAREACIAAAEALGGEHGREVEACPMTDGGDGFREVLTTASRGVTHEVSVTGPRGQSVRAGIGMIDAAGVPAAVLHLLEPAYAATAGSRRSRSIAVVEMAEASGLALLAPDERDPWLTTSRGTGELLAAAAARGADTILLGVGGSATNDLGIGALGALGVYGIDESGALVGAPSPKHWSSVVGFHGKPAPYLPRIRIACDVDNPLLGERGAAAVFGPQKGLAGQDLPRMEATMDRMARMLCGHFDRKAVLVRAPGAGAAGGIAFGLMAGAGATLIAGADLVAAWLDIEKRIGCSDIVITGEGHFDDTSLTGKGPGTIATRAAALGKQVHVFAGRVSVPLDRLAARGITPHTITASGTPLDEALRGTRANLIAAIRRVFDAA